MYVVAGPNGAGKSTLASRARETVGVTPIDPDAIQRESGMSNSAAWAEGLRRCREAIANNTSFLVETTLAGRDPARPSTFLKLMAEAKSRGFRVDLTFIALENAGAHVARVADRVAAGLHDIPEIRSASATRRVSHVQRTRLDLRTMRFSSITHRLCCRFEPLRNSKMAALSQSFSSFRRGL